MSTGVRWGSVDGVDAASTCRHDVGGVDAEVRSNRGQRSFR